MNQNIYSRMRQILKGNFNDVRDGWASMPLYIDVDLSVARTELNPLILNIAGNSFYIDQLPEGGNATVTFQDTSSARGSAPIYCQQGSVFYVPFTQIELKNEVQVGKVLRIIYGVDLDFAAGTATNVVVSGTVNVKDSGRTYGASLAQAYTIPIDNAAVQLIAPAANINGISIVNCTLVGERTAANAFTTSLVAKNGIPATVVDGDVLVTSYDTMANFSGRQVQCGKLTTPISVPAGKGVYIISNAVSVGIVTMLYTML